MRFKLMFVALLLAQLQVSTPTAVANELPKNESLTITPQEIELTNSSADVIFEFIVSHPFGIENKYTIATVTNGTNVFIGTVLERIDYPINYSLKKVTFRGKLSLPRDTSPGIYSVYVDGVMNNRSAGYQYNSERFNLEKVRSLVGAESGLLIRSGGFLKLSYPTFTGPTYDTTLQNSFTDTVKFRIGKTPFWKVGEKINLNDYFEKNIPGVELKASSSAPEVCKVQGSEILLVNQGVCVYRVFTEENKDYVAKSYSSSVNVGPARTKPIITAPVVETQTVNDISKVIALGQVYGPGYGWVLPETTTPNVCIATANFVKIVGGGKCILTYKTPESENFLESDITNLTFDVTKNLQTITFTLPSTANVSTRSIALAATASSGEAITYSTASAGICSITGSTLSLLRNGNCEVTATQAGTSTLAPASATATVVLSGAAVSNRKTITCVKGKSTKRVSGVNPKCPRGFKIKGK